MIGARQFIARLGQLPDLVEGELRKALEQGANEAVAVIDSMAPAPLRGRVRWRWGPPPKGTRLLMSAGGEGALQVSIYLPDIAKEGDRGDTRAHWFEFGTGPRYQKTTGRYTGAMPATPFFYPGWRLVRKRARARIARALSAGIRKSGLAG